MTDTPYSDDLEEILNTHAQEFKAGHLGALKQLLLAREQRLVNEARIKELELRQSDLSWAIGYTNGARFLVAEIERVERRLVALRKELE